MNQHLLQQLRAYLKECDAEGNDPLGGGSVIAEELRLLVDRMGKKESPAHEDLQVVLARACRTDLPTIDTSNHFGGEHPDVIARFGLDTPEVKAMSYSQRRAANLPVCRRDHTGRCVECQHQGPCAYSRVYGGTR